MVELDFYLQKNSVEKLAKILGEKSVAKSMEKSEENLSEKIDGKNRRKKEVAE